MTRKWIVGATAAGLLAGCGADQVAGIQGSGTPVAAGVTVVGPINGFGSIILDGVEYATSGAQVRIEDQPGAESQLRVGQIVTIKGTVDANGTTGTATEVSFSDDLRGPVAQIALTNNTFVVLGTTVRVTDATLFDESISPADLTSLQNGALVHVSGFANAAGDIVASRVDLASASASLQVRGAVQSLDTVAQTFRINSLTVDYKNAMLTGTLANGSVVTAQGLSVSPAGVLAAARVQVSAGLGAAPNDGGRIEGVVTSFVSNADFSVDGQRVVTDGNTQFVPQNATLGLNVGVKVRGTFNAAGTLVASRVEVKPQTLSLVRGLVESVPSASTLTVLGVTVTTSAATAFEDNSSQHVRLFRLSDVHSGDYVEVRGTASPSGGLAATLVERDPMESRSYVQGLVTSIANPNFTVLGVNVATDVQTHFIGVGGLDQAAAQFFAQAPNQIVKARGTWAGTVLTADQAQIRQ